MPSVLPARPDDPVAKEVIVRGIKGTEYHCTTAYAEVIKRPPPVQNAFYANIEQVQACLYAFEKGVKINLVFTSIIRMESLTSSIFGGITKAIRGDDSDRIAGQLTENIEAIRKNIPTLLIERIDIPGKQTEEPDKQAVAALIPPRTEAPAQAPASAVQAAAPTAAPAASPAGKPGLDLTFVGSRKELAAMGFKFYDQDQFVDAARRNDFLTVRLFLAAAAIKPSAPDSKGDTALALAPKGSEMALWVSLFCDEEKAGRYPPDVAAAVMSK